MPGEKSFNCQMDISFAHTQGGRPELYDFLWEHLPNLVNTLNEKTIQLKLQPPGSYSKWAKLTGMKPLEMEHAIRKIQEDKRFDAGASFDREDVSPLLELNVRAEDLDHVLNAHNILFERFLPYLKMEGNNVAIDFSTAEKNTVQCFSTSQQKPLINTFLVRNLKQAPRVRSIVFASLEERRRGL